MGSIEREREKREEASAAVQEERKHELRSKNLAENGGAAAEEEDENGKWRRNGPSAVTKVQSSFPKRVQVSLLGTRL